MPAKRCVYLDEASRRVSISADSSTKFRVAKRRKAVGSLTNRTLRRLPFPHLLLQP